MKFVKYCVAALLATASASSVDMTEQSTEAAQQHQMLEQLVTVPIDEKRALTLKVSPTYTLDSVNSVTLKSFRKIVGYDTFESIRKKTRGESKDTSDYYNVTVSMMIQRKPVEAAAAPTADPYAPNGAATLASTLDKGFPYDDGDSSIDDMVPKWKSPKAPQPATLVGRLNE